MITIAAARCKIGTVPTLVRALAGAALALCLLVVVLGVAWRAIKAALATRDMYSAIASRSASIHRSRLLEITDALTAGARH